MTPRLAAALALLLAMPAAAQVRPGPSCPDPHFQRFDYVPDRVFAVEVTPGYQLTLSLAPDERIETVALGDAVAWQVTASKGGNTLFVKALRTGETTNMTVVTNVRRYAFELRAATDGGANTAYAITFQYPQGIGVAAAQPLRMIGLYTMHGDKTLWPERISDDGVHVYMEWPESVDLPAVYVVDSQGREALSNGMMRGGRLVLDSVGPRVVFRIDKHVAIAERYLPGTKRR